MRFPTLIFKNLLRRKTRSAFAVLGISIGIATIIALGAVTDGLKLSMDQVLKTGEADFLIAEKGAADLMFSTIDREKIVEIEKVEGVRRVTGVLFTVYAVSDKPYFIVFGVRSQDLPLVGAEITEGTVFSEESENEIILGKVASKEMNRSIGDELSLDENKFQIIGIFETGSPMQDGGSMLSLGVLQKMQKKEEQLTMIYVDLEENVDIESVCQQIEENHQSLVTIKSVAEFSKVDKGLEIVDEVSLIVSFLAILIGGIGVMNTIMMSVYERTREIGVLRALGWKRMRILGIILGESILLCLFAILFGSLIGVFGVELLMLHPMIRGYLQPLYTWSVFARALLVALLVGLLGGLYPAYRASKLPPSEALRYE
jgi:putative ABC transport system permease protein